MLRPIRRSGTLKSLALYARDPHLLARMERLTPRDEALQVTVLPPDANLAESLLFPSPDLVVVGLGAGDDGLKPFFEELDGDPWLSTMPFLMVTPDNEKTIELYGPHRVVYFLETEDLERGFARVLRILLTGAEAFRGSGLIDKLTPLSGELEIDTDLFLAPYYAGLFANYLQKEGRISAANKYGLQLALIELLVNAMEHGNAGIGSAEKTAWLAENHTIQELVERRMKEPGRAGRKVRVAYRISPMTSSFQITDEGEGFDHTSATANGPASLLAAHGRGILTSRGSVDRFSYNEKGNSVTIEIDHDGPAERTVPPGFVDQPPLNVRTGDVVFSEGDRADSLFYIVSGEYDVFVKGRRLLTANASDIFLGEMSFILGARRGATVVARREGQLVRISGEAFTRAAKRYPSYGIFLCKLFAARLRDAHSRYAELVGDDR
jgi:anti-sigma regulatory factor (Ser/Thr protein kinase)